MKCSGCGKADIIADTIDGEYYCPNCGLSFDFMFDYSVPWYKEGGPGYTTTSFTLVNKGFETRVPKNLRLKKGEKRLSKSVRRMKFYRDDVEKSFAKVRRIISLVWCKWRLPQYIREESGLLYRKCARAGLTKGRDSYSMSVAVVYAACESHLINRNIEGMIKDLDDNALISDVLNYIKVIKKRFYKVQSKDRVQDYIEICIKKLEISSAMALEAKELEKEITHKRLEIGKRPAVVTGAIIYKASLKLGQPLNQSKIAKALKISERSIRRVHNELFRE
jgi:transcription initiation factor TFIIIB Brf1 subunit/transcription initiation factor TFIIB